MNASENDSFESDWFWSKASVTVIGRFFQSRAASMSSSLEMSCS